ncbi:MFS transporter [Rhizobium sp. 18065]|uniref:MFS transporter n=1 Tax=Rhizobium sp. 18065 TaxID=2681411 RepID=UPI001356D825|nr:MFS transporter [Rhizobium sp. 18065]
MKLSPATIGLGVSMTIGYGTLYYSFSVLAPEIAGEFGWDESFVFAIFSLGLLAGAVSAPIVGRQIDRFGARLVMSLGSLLAALSLVLLALMQNAWQFAAIALAAEFVAIAVQYDAGFAALAQRHGRNARAEITLVTLIAGFASTIFWPLLQWLLTLMSWRDVYLVLAAMNLLIALPIHLAMPRDVPARADEGGAKALPERGDEANKAEGQEMRSQPAIPVASDRRQMVLMAISFAGGGFVMSAIGAALLVLLGDLGFAAATATFAASFIGPSQVGARLIEYLRRSLFSPPLTAVIAAVAITLAMALLCLTLVQPWPIAIFAFAVVYGIGQGLTSIVRGMLPLHYFGPDGYGRRTGALSGIRMVLSAAAPFSIIVLNEKLGPAAALACLVLVATASTIAMLALVRLDTRPQPQSA